MTGRQRVGLPFSLGIQIDYTVKSRIEEKIRRGGKRLGLGRKNVKDKRKNKFKGHREGSKESKEDSQMELEAEAGTGEEVKEVHSVKGTYLSVLYLVKKTLIFDTVPRAKGPIFVFIFPTYFFIIATIIYI